MAGVKKKVESKRYNLVIPTNDTDVLQWMALQNNYSQSIRQLIKQEIQKGGFVDLFCKPIANPGVTPGRPVKVSHEPPVADETVQIAQVVSQPTPKVEKVEKKVEVAEPPKTEPQVAVATEEDAVSAVSGAFGDMFS